jgi:hypothetical protein
MYYKRKNIILLLIVYILYKNGIKYIRNNIFWNKNMKKHNFWDNQSVSRNSILVKKEEYNSTILPNNYEWDNFKIDFNFYNFLLDNYVNNEIYTYDRLKWIFDKVKTKYNIKIIKKSDNKVIGTITGRVIKIYIYDKIKECIYVDFLCIDKEYRNKRLAPLLISKILEITANNNYEFTIFKIDNKPLPFDFIGKYTYYYYNLIEYPYKFIKKNTISRFDITLENVETVYKYYIEYINQNNSKLNKMYDLESFGNEFVSQENLVYGSYFEKNKEIIGISLIINTKYIIDNSSVNTAELQYLFTNNDNIIPIINILLLTCKNLEFIYFISLDIMNNDKFINEFKFKQSYSTFYQVQNYKTEIVTKEFNFLNFL